MSDRMLGLMFLVVSIALEACAQMCFKRGADRATAGPAGLTGWLRQSRFILAGILCYVGQGIMWTLTLHKLPLSVAHPVGSLTFVAVAMLSWSFLHERVGPRRWAGVALILLGTMLIAGT